MKMKLVFYLILMCLLFSVAQAQQTALRMVSCRIPTLTNADKREVCRLFARKFMDSGADIMILQDVGEETLDSLAFDWYKELGKEMVGFNGYLSDFPDKGLAVFSKIEALTGETLSLADNNDTGVALISEYDEFVVCGVRVSADINKQKIALSRLAKELYCYNKPVYVAVRLSGLPGSELLDSVKKNFTILSYFNQNKQSKEAEYVLGYNGKKEPYAVSGNWLLNSAQDTVCPLMVEVLLKTPTDQIFRTEPYLQNPVGKGITVSWLTNVPVYSWVEFGADTTHLQKARTIVDGQVICNNYIHKIRLQDLIPGQTYYYRICSQEILDYGAYSKTFGNTAISEFHTFRLPKSGDKNFTALIFNDIHKQYKTMAALYEQVKDCNYDFVIFNGDCIDDPANEEESVCSLAFYNNTVNAANIPVFYLRGNHEIRNAYSIQLRELFDYVGDKTYGAFSWGDTRFVMLDCGEDKPDDHWVYYGLNDFTQLREEQVDFLEKELHSKRFKQAGKKVLMHHIPLYGNDYDYNPCLELWGHLLKKAPFNISINAHTHVYASHPKGSLGNNYPVVIGGGYDMDEATVMVLKREGDIMTLKVINTKGEIVEEFKL